MFRVSIRSNMSLRCGFSRVLRAWKAENRTYLTQLSQWNSNSSRAVFDLMFRSFLEIVTSDTVEDLPYSASYRSHMAPLHAMTVCTCRASWRRATDSGKGKEIERPPPFFMLSSVFRMLNLAGRSGLRGFPLRGEFGGRFSCSGGWGTTDANMEPR